MAQALSSSVSIFSQSKLVNKFRVYSTILLPCYSFNDSILKLGIPKRARRRKHYLIEMYVCCVCLLLMLYTIYIVYTTSSLRRSINFLRFSIQLPTLYISLSLSLSHTINEKDSQVKSGYSSFNIIFLYSTDLKIILNNLRHPEIIIDKQYYTA